MCHHLHSSGILGRPFSDTAAGVLLGKFSVSGSGRHGWGSKNSVRTLAVAISGQPVPRKDRFLAILTSLEGSSLRQIDLVWRDCGSSMTLKVVLLCFSYRMALGQYSSYSTPTRQINRGCRMYWNQRPRVSSLFSVHLGQV